MKLLCFIRWALYVGFRYILLHSCGFGCVYFNAEHCHIILDVRDAADAKGLDEHLCDIRREERGECGSEVDVLHAEMEQRKENNDRLLLVPRNVVRNRELVHIIQTEYFLKLQRDQRERVGVVALTGIEDARDTADVTEILLDVLVLRAACREDDCVVWQSLSELSIVLTRLHASIAARHDDELLDRAALHRLDNLVRDGKDLLMREAADDLARLQLRRRRTLLRALDDGRKVFLTVHERDVRAARYADCRRREEAILVAVLRRNDAVRRHEDRAVELLELLFLQPT